MNKIAIVGAHGVGKTSLAKILSKEYNLPLVSDYAAVAYHQGFRVNEYTTIENQFWILASQIEAERKEISGFVADKSLLDNIVYSKYLFEDQRVLTLIDDIVFKNLEYSHYIYIPIEFGIEADGRSTDVAFQKQIDLDYLKILNKYKIDYIKVTGTILERVNIVKSVIN